jgi:hypothetical protein
MKFFHKTPEQPPAIPWDSNTMRIRHPKAGEGKIAVEGPADVLWKGRRLAFMGEELLITGVGRTFPKRGTSYVYAYFDDFSRARPSVQRKARPESAERRGERIREAGKGTGRSSGGMGL